MLDKRDHRIRWCRYSQTCDPLLLLASIWGLCFLHNTFLQINILATPCGLCIFTIPNYIWSLQVHKETGWSAQGLQLVCRVVFFNEIKGKEQEYHKASTRQLNTPIYQNFDPTNRLSLIQLQKGRGQSGTRIKAGLLPCKNRPSTWIQ